MATFTDEDNRILEKTMSVREAILDRLNKETRTDVGFINSFVNLAESMDRSVLAKAKVKVEDDANKINSANKEALTEFLLTIHNNTLNTPSHKADREIPKYVPNEDDKVHDAELLLKEDRIDVREYLASLDAED